MFIRDSRRSYRTYSYAGLILITDLFSVGTPVGVTELILCRTSTYTTEFTLVRRYPKVSQRLRNMYRYCGTYSYTEVLVSTTELILILWSIYWSYRTWTCISDTEVPVGTTEYFTGTRVPVGTTVLILTLSIREYP